MINNKLLIVGNIIQSHMLNQTLIHISQAAQLGGMPETHKDFVALAQDIYDTVGECVSSSTLKRIFGKVTSSSAPSLAVLNIIGRYLGYDNWEDYQESLRNGVSALIDFSIREDGSCQYLCPDNLRMGAIVEITYNPNRKAQFIYIGESLFRIISIKDSILHIGDILDIRSFQVGSALMGGNIFRDGKSLGQGFRLACINGGICNLRIL